MRYITIHDASKNELKYDVLPDRVNTHAFCDKWINNYQLQIFATNTIFDKLKLLYDSGDCGMALIERRLCVAHYYRCPLRSEFSMNNLIIQEAMLPKCISGNTSGLSTTLYDAFLKDINKPVLEIRDGNIGVKGLDDENDKYGDTNRSFC